MEKNKRKTVPLKELPTNEEITKKIKEFRMLSEKSQAELAKAIGKSRTWLAQLEFGGIDPIFFFRSFEKLYGKEKAIEVYGEDWDLYTGERVALYFAYYKVNRKDSCDILNLSYTALRYLLNQPDKYMSKHKEGIDQLFPNIHFDDLTHYHLIGKNSMCFVQNDVALIMLNENSNFKHKDLSNHSISLLNDVLLVGMSYEPGGKESHLLWNSTNI